MSTLGEELRRHRQEQEQSLAWLGEELGKSKSFLAAVERNEKVLSVHGLEAWMNALGLDGDDRWSLFRHLLRSHPVLTFKPPEKEWQVDFLAAAFYAMGRLRKSKLVTEVLKLLLSVR